MFYLYFFGVHCKSRSTVVHYVHYSARENPLMYCYNISAATAALRLLQPASLLFGCTKNNYGCLNYHTLKDVHAGLSRSSRSVPNSRLFHNQLRKVQ